MAPEDIATHTPTKAASIALTVSKTSLGVRGVLTTAGTFTLVALTSTFAGSRSKAEIPRLASVLVGLVTGAWAEVCSSCTRVYARPATRGHFRRDPHGVGPR
jgi:hypothetical protein